MCSWMQTNARHTTALAMPLSRKAADSGEGFMTHSIFFVKCLAAEWVELVEEFSRRFSAAATQAEDRQRGSDLRYDMQISLEEAAFGAEKEIEIRKLDACEKCDGSGAEPGSRTISCPTCGGRGQVISSRGFFQISQTCPRCRGAGRIIEKPCRKCHGEGRIERTSRIKLKIPAGISEGSRLRSSRNGEAGIRGGPHGDLYVVIHIKEHKVFQRDEDNLYCEVPIPFAIAALGGEIEVPTLHGKANLKVPAGTQSGQIFKFAGKESSMSMVASTAICSLVCLWKFRRDSIPSSDQNWRSLPVFVATIILRCAKVSSNERKSSFDNENFFQRITPASSEIDCMKHDDDGKISRERMVELLNEDLAREYQAIIAYVIYSQILKQAQYMEIAKELEKHAAEELSHAIAVANQIDYFNGTPTNKPKEIKFRTNPRRCCALTLENERQTLINYRQRICQADAMGEFALGGSVAQDHCPGTGASDRSRQRSGHRHARNLEVATLPASSTLFNVILNGVKNLKSFRKAVILVRIKTNDQRCFSSLHMTAGVYLGLKQFV